MIKNETTQATNTEGSTMTTTTTTMIHGENGISIASMLEYLQQPNHPFHAQAVEQAAAFVTAEKNAENLRNQRMMREQMQYITADEWSSIVD